MIKALFLYILNDGEYVEGRVRDGVYLLVTDRNLRVENSIVFKINFLIIIYIFIKFINL
jgi:hypothetical protein